MTRVFALEAMAAFYSHAAAVDPPRAREIEERKDDLMRQLAICESGGYGDSERPIYGGGGDFRAGATSGTGRPAAINSASSIMSPRSKRCDGHVALDVHWREQR